MEFSRTAIAALVLSATRQVYIAQREGYREQAYPWVPTTLADYPDDGNRRLLHRYGDMLGSLSHQADSSSVRIGFGQPYATHHEWGTEHMPRRGLLMGDPDAGTLGPEDEAAVLDILGLWLEGLA